MIITSELNGKELNIKLEGRLDTMTAPELEQELKGKLEGVNNLIIDMSDLEYISSAGLRTLLFAKRELYGKGTVKVTGANDMVMEVFEVTGFVDILDVA